MKFGSSIFFVALLFLSACTGGYSRPYIISDTNEEAVSNEASRERL